MRAVATGDFHTSTNYATVNSNHIIIRRAASQQSGS
jgi:hypothetical protein